MQGYLSLILHAHLPFVRHPEHPRFLEENWLFEAITETYLPLLRVLEGWSKDGMQAPITPTFSPTLCSMLLDPLLQSRYRRHLHDLIELADKETHRTLWEKPLHQLAIAYLERFRGIREYYDACGGNLIARFAQLQDKGLIEIATCSATHALLPLLAEHPPSVRAQVLVARDHYRSCFGRDPQGIWLPECAYVPELETPLCEAGLRWFVLDTHGVLQAHPPPRYGIFAPIVTPNGLAVFGRDLASDKQVWSRDEGYPGDPWYRDFYRDIGFDLDLDYLRPYLAAPEQRSFTGIKYHRITGSNPGKAVYQPQMALARADEHAGHFLAARIEQIGRLTQIMDSPPILLCPYDAELFGHWWYEGLEFLNYFVRKAYFDQQTFRLTTPGAFLRQHRTHQVASPAPSSWGEQGYWGMWLNETNEWIYPHLRVAQERMTELVQRFQPSLAGPDAKSKGASSSRETPSLLSPRQALHDRGTSGSPSPQPSPPGEGEQGAPSSVEVAAAFAPQTEALRQRALRQAARELLLAQASDWPFILRTGTSPEYARKRVTEHLQRFNELYEQLLESRLDESWLAQIESQDEIFPAIDHRYFG